MIQLVVIKGKLLIKIDPGQGYTYLIATIIITSLDDYTKFRCLIDCDEIYVMLKNISSSFNSTKAIEPALLQMKTKSPTSRWSM